MKTDESFLSGALRETQEELGIDPARIEVLGEIGPPEINLRGDMTVWPFVASLSNCRICNDTLLTCRYNRVLFTLLRSKGALLDRRTSHSPPLI